MAAGSIVRHDCGRLIIWGQTCECEDVIRLSCDCTSDGNTEHTGPTCAYRERAAWKRTMRVTRKIVQR